MMQGGVLQQLHLRGDVYQCGRDDAWREGAGEWIRSSTKSNLNKWQMINDKMDSLVQKCAPTAK
jgi:hypothetical protein